MYYDSLPLDVIVKEPQKVNLQAGLLDEEDCVIDKDVAKSYTQVDDNDNHFMHPLLLLQLIDQGETLVLINVYWKSTNMLILL
jgi:hypothetical protein